MKYLLRPYRIQEKANSGVRLRYQRTLIAVLLVSGCFAGGSCSFAGAQGMQFADLIRSSSHLLLHSRSQGYMGIFVGDVEPERVQALHLKDAHGAEITVLDHDAPAAKVGLRLHDVVLEMNGTTIDDAEQMKGMLRRIGVGKKVQLTISRDGVPQNFTVPMADRYKMQEEARQQLDSAGTSGSRGQGFFSGAGDVPASNGGFHLWSLGSSMHVGALVEPLAPQTAELLGVNGGVMIKSVAHKSAADAAGLKPHDVVVGIGGEQVLTSSDFERLLRTSEGKPVQVEILRDRVRQLVLLQVDGKRHRI